MIAMKPLYTLPKIVSKELSSAARNLANSLTFPSIQVFSISADLPELSGKCVNCERSIARGSTKCSECQSLRSLPIIPELSF